jgi:hypothetical protein
VLPFDNNNIKQEIVHVVYLFENPPYIRNKNKKKTRRQSNDKKKQQK